MTQTKMLFTQLLAATSTEIGGSDPTYMGIGSQIPATLPWVLLLGLAAYYLLRSRRLSRLNNKYSSAISYAKKLQTLLSKYVDIAGATTSEKTKLSELDRYFDTLEGAIRDIVQSEDRSMILSDSNFPKPPVKRALLQPIGLTLLTSFFTLGIAQWMNLWRLNIFVLCIHIIMVFVAIICVIYAFRALERQRAKNFVLDKTILTQQQIVNDIKHEVAEVEGRIRQLAESQTENSKDLIKLADTMALFCALTTTNLPFSSNIVHAITELVKRVEVTAQRINASFTPDIPEQVLSLYSSQEATLMLNTLFYTLLKSDVKDIAAQFSDNRLKVTATDLSASRVLSADPESIHSLDLLACKFLTEKYDRKIVLSDDTRQLDMEI